jgi:hypothetical protein
MALGRGAALAAPANGTPDLEPITESIPHRGQGAVVSSPLTSSPTQSRISVRERRAKSKVLQGRCYPTRAVDLDREEDDEPRRLFSGRTCEGRHLAVVAVPRPGGVLRPITCWPLSEKSTKSYEAWRRTVKR